MNAKHQLVNPREKLESVNSHWSPKIIGELNGQHVKIAKFKGDFVMHEHEREDELFFVIEGKLFMELEEETLEIGQGEFVIIPAGMPHKPFAPEEVSVMMFEPASTLNTGNVESELTVTNPERI